jgi:hypothetical protein
MDPINPLTSILPTGPIRSQGQGRQPGQNSPPLGQLLKALVVEARSETQFILEIGGNRLTAKSETPLPVGQMLQLQVAKTAPQIELKIVSDSLGQFIGRSITLLGKNIDLSALFKGIQALTPSPLDTISTTSKSTLESFFTLQQTDVGSKDGGAVLKQLVENLGMNFEMLLARGDKSAAIQTIKGALLELAATFSSAERIADSTAKILTTLELFQFAQLHTSSENQIIFPIPLPFVDQGYLVFERNTGEDETADGEQTEQSFSLHLTMTELGNLQIDFLQSKDKLLINFKAESQEKVDFIKQFAEELTSSIGDIENIGIHFSSDAPNPIHDLIKEMLPPGSSMLDTKA